MQTEPQTVVTESPDGSGSKRKVALIAGAAAVVVVIIIVAILFAGGFFTQGEEESNAASSQSQDATSVPVEARTVTTDHFTFVMPESWANKVTWTVDHQSYPSSAGNGGPNQELFYYYFYLIDGEVHKDQVMSVLVTNDATGMLGEATQLGEFTANGGFKGYICFCDNFLKTESASGANDALIADLQSGGQVKHAPSDSMEKRKTDSQIIETWMKANVVPQITASPTAASANADLGFKGITSVRASSTLPTDDINIRNYSAESIIDGNQNTCWCENVPGVGVDEYVAFSGSGEQSFHGFKIRNGHQYSIQLYYKNARATSLRVLVDGEEKETVQLGDEGLNWQTITFAQPYTGKEIVLQIASAESGSSYDDCCISEVELF